MASPVPLEIAKVVLALFSNLQPEARSSLLFILGLVIQGIIYGTIAVVVVGQRYLDALGLLIAGRPDFILQDLVEPLLGTFVWRTGDYPTFDCHNLIGITLELLIQSGSYVITSFLLVKVGASLGILLRFDWPYVKLLVILAVLILEYRLRLLPWPLLLSWYASYRKFDDRITRYKWLILWSIWDMFGEARRHCVKGSWVWNNVTCRKIDAKYNLYRGTPLYKYSQLESSTIRLLEISRRIPFGPIRCRMRYSVLEDAPPFETISYTWGNTTEKTHVVYIDGHRFETTATVYDILVERSTFLRPSLIWIDSICIDQSNTEEKGFQVGMMRDIYQKATRTVVCLGDCNDAHLVRPILQGIAFLIENVEQEALEKTLLQRYLTSVHSPPWQAFLKFLRHPYFHRVWVIQEVAVSTKVDVVYGGEIVPWRIIEVVVEALQDKSVANFYVLLMQAETEAKFQTESTDGVTCIRTLGGVRRNIHSANSLYFGEVLEKFRRCHATDPKDKVYALLGLTTDSTDIPIIYDSSLDLKDLYIATANHFILKEEYFEICIHAGIGFSRNLEHIPSWVPDWTSQHEAIPLGSRYILGPEYRASLDRRAAVDLDTTANVLAILGRNLDRIASLSEIVDQEINTATQYSLSGEPEKLAQWYKAAREMFSKLAKEDENEAYVHIKYQSLREAFWRTLIGDRDLEERPVRAIYESHFEKWEYTIINAPEANLKRDDIEGAWEQIFGTKMHDPSNPDFSFEASFREALSPVITFGERWGGVFRQRRFAITEKGYMAVVPPLTKVGDQICVLFGGDTPFVIRVLDVSDAGSKGSVSSGNSENPYELVGECYVHGAMDGQVFDLDGEDVWFDFY